jgi:GNAT superfamily N-acetyltransferase
MHPLIEIRMGRVDERLELEALQRRASLAWEDYRAQLLAHPDAIELPEDYLREERVRVAEIDGRVVGFSCVLSGAAGTAELDGLFVEPKHWRTGIGRRLLEDALTRARENAIDAIEVVAKPRAEEFYRRLGFAVLGRVETRFGPANRMRLETR